MAQKSNAGADRQAKIQAASKASGGGANKIVIAAVVAVLAIVAVVGGVVWSQVSATKEAKGDGNATPAGATMGTAYTAFADATPKAGAPTVEVFEDFQCPACQQAEGILGSTLAELAQAGDIKLQYHVLNFLDRKLGNDGSVLAANGAFCAAEDGKFQEFHDAAYLNQPTEGSGWTVAGLKKLAEGAGLSGAALDTWQTCVEVGSTPTTSTRSTRMPSAPRASRAHRATRSTASSWTSRPSPPRTCSRPPSPRRRSR